MSHSTQGQKMSDSHELGSSSITQQTVYHQPVTAEPTVNSDPEAQVQDDSMTGVVRHDNDMRDITQIESMPTTEELYSSKLEYLPTTDPRTWHKRGLEGLVDRQFRLFREDNVGILRDSIRSYLNIPFTWKRHSSAEFNVYHNVLLDSELSFDLHGGLVFSMRLPQPQEAHALTPSERYEWWVKKQGFQHDTLVCLWSKDMDLMFASVGHYKDHNLLKNDYGSDKAKIFFRPFEQSARFTSWLLRNANQRVERNYTLLEFPNLLTWSFAPPLRALKQMSTMSDTPLSTALEPSELPKPIWIHPAHYAMGDGFNFQLGKTVAGDGQGELAVSDLFESTAIPAGSSLDDGQARAFLHALRHRIALIQGPPGTGKSYTAVAVIETLLRSLDGDISGPIMCVSHSNRALDGLLEKLLNAGVGNMIRVGGQSKSDALENINLDVLVRNQAQLPEDKQAITKAAGKFFRNSKGIRSDLAKLARVDQDGEREQICSGIKKKFSKWTEAQQEYSAAMERHPLGILQKANIIGVTAGGMAVRRELFEKLDCKVIVFEEAGTIPEALVLTSITPSMEHCILIGDHFQLRPKVNRKELESNTNPDAAKFGFDVSLLERLVHFGFPFEVLNTQYRMRPEISRLSRSTLYPMLKDAAAVQHLSAVPSLSERMFWFDHQHHELKLDKTARVNAFEARMIAGLTRHLTSQDGVHGDTILILTPYAAQAKALQEKIEGFHPVEVVFGKDGRDQQPNDAASGRIRIATVDSIQGDESDIVLLSMVRSNDWEGTGFIKSANRSIVALSRARRAMFIFGNMKMLQQVPFWAQIISSLDETSSIGTALAIDCPRHPGNTIHIKEPADFGKHSPNGGCVVSCGRLLACNHRCPELCHSDLLHDRTICIQPCRSILDCGHPCANICGSACTTYCEVRIQNPRVILPTRSSFRNRARHPSRFNLTAAIKPNAFVLKATSHSVEALAENFFHAAIVASYNATRAIVARRANHPVGTKQFVMNTRSQYIKLAHEAVQEIRRLQASLPTASANLNKRFSKSATITSDAAGKRTHISKIHRLAGRDGRYKHVVRILHDISATFQLAKAVEAAIQSAWDHHHHHSCQPLMNPPTTTPTPQLQERLLLLLLSARLEIAALSDFLTIRSHAGACDPLTLDFRFCRARCAHVFHATHARSLPGLSVEADILWAQWLVLERRAPPAPAPIPDVDADEARYRLRRAEGALDPEAVGAFMDGAHCVGLLGEVWSAEGPLAREERRWSADTGVRLDGFVAGVEAMGKEVEGAVAWEMCEAGHYFPVAAAGGGVCSGCGRRAWDMSAIGGAGEEDALMGERSGQGAEDEMEGVESLSH
ncbi:nf-x1 finger and helicase domain protein [Diplodia corticola]|uniref:Nf-x1 finger and helicase domain protein n=1 Tax=Diplodia corticola TaxID=236234 RepID=A0A1J9R7X4_9PEZI|nr:nf-x1 finger and helicase domain protein [Diplodia corticola]OJD36696.1 nf-x1 finger and helicase domain protein [Diplodia corticola]